MDFEVLRFHNIARSSLPRGQILVLSIQKDSLLLFLTTTYSYFFGVMGSAWLDFVLMQVFHCLTRSSICLLRFGRQRPLIRDIYCLLFSYNFAKTHEIYMLNLKKKDEVREPKEANKACV